MDCWDPETSEPPDAYLRFSYLEWFFFEVSMDLTVGSIYGFPDEWFTYELSDEEAVGLPAGCLLDSVYFFLDGPNLDYSFSEGITFEVGYPDVPPFWRIITQVHVPPGNGCIDLFIPQELEHSFELQDAYPNPCNGSAVIEYSLPATQQAELAVYNLRGQQMALLASGLQEAGEHSVRVEMDTWPSGVYLCRLRSDGLCRSTRIVLMR